MVFWCFLKISCFFLCSPWAGHFGMFCFCCCFCCHCCCCCGWWYWWFSSFYFLLVIFKDRTRIKHWYINHHRTTYTTPKNITITIQKHLGFGQQKTCKNHSKTVKHITKTTENRCVSSSGVTFLLPVAPLKPRGFTTSIESSICPPSTNTPIGLIITWPMELPGMPGFESRGLKANGF